MHEQHLAGEISAMRTKLPFVPQAEFESVIVSVQTVYKQATMAMQMADMLSEGTVPQERVIALLDQVAGFWLDTLTPLQRARMESLEWQSMLKEN